MKKIIFLFFAAMMSFSCSDDNPAQEEPQTAEDAFIRGADISFLPEIEADGAVYYSDGQPQDALLTLKNAGVNTVRIRLWKNPATPQSGFAQVKALAQRVRNTGMKVWLTVHYSDTWADPANQEIPAEWEDLSLEALKIAAKNYTSTILAEIKPDILQIGNETNSGFMYPHGNLLTNETGFLQLVAAVSATIRQDAPNTKIMLHYAGINGAEWFFNKTEGIDYDYIGLSYYPVWHGKDIVALKNIITTLGTQHNKQVVVAETAYPFTLGYNDWTNNIVGEEGQLVPGYPATPQGQKDFITAVRTAVETSGKGAGFCYWGSEWISSKGDQATNGSTFENQAFWDFENNALPVLEAFKK